MPSGCDDCVKKSLKSVTPRTGSNSDTPIATVIPIRIANPPSVGVGLAWTLRSLGWSTAPIFNASRRTAGVKKNVTPAATSATTTYGIIELDDVRVRPEAVGQRGDFLAHLLLAFG
jgi:hypothetical protein